MSFTDADEIRWHAWQARGVVQDRRTATMMGRLLIPIAIALAAWLAVQVIRL